MASAATDELQVQIARRTAELHLRRPDLAGPDCHCPTCKPADSPVSHAEAEAFRRELERDA